MEIQERVTRGRHQALEDDIRDFYMSSFLVF